MDEDIGIFSVFDKTPMKKSCFPLFLIILLTTVSCSQTSVSHQSTNRNFVSPTVTPTIIPTLSIMEAEQAVSTFVNDNGDCAFPCWWGVIPGKSQWTIEKQRLSILATKVLESDTVDGQKVVSLFFPTNENGYYQKQIPVKMYVDQETDIIERIMVGQYYSIEGLIQEYGVPEEIYVSLASIPETGPLEFTLEFFYQSKGISATIYGPGGVIRQGENDIGIICKQDIINRGNGLILWDPETEILFTDLGLRDDLINIGDVANVDNNEVVNLILLDEMDTCVEIPLSYWYP